MASVVAANPALVEEILSWLPPKSVILFKSVCKQWHHISSTPFFLAAHTRRNPHKISGFLVNVSPLHRKKVHDTSCTLDGRRFWRTFPEPCTLDNFDGASILRCCNGLVLGMGLCSSGHRSLGLLLWVCNPTTRQLRTLPDAGTEYASSNVVLAFDPSQSVNYRVLCVSYYHPEDIRVYRSETDTWEAFFVQRPRVLCTPSRWYNCCYCRGNVYCLKDDDGSVVALDVERRSVETMTTRPPPTDDNFQTAEFCQSARSGLLRWVRHNLGIYHGPARSKVVEIYEMRKDQMEWIPLHKVHVLDMLTGVPPPTMMGIDFFFPVSWDAGHTAREFLFVEGQEDEEGNGEDRLVLRLSCWKVVTYNLKSRTHDELFTINFRPELVALYACAHTLAAP